MLVAMVLLITNIIIRLTTTITTTFNLQLISLTFDSEKLQQPKRSTTHTTHIHAPQVERESRLQVSRLVCLQAVLRDTEEKVAIYQECMARFKKESVWSG